MELNRPDVGVFKGMTTQPNDFTHRRNFPSVNNKHNFDHEHPNPNANYTQLSSMSRQDYRRPEYIPYQRPDANSNRSTLLLGTDKPNFSSVAKDSFKGYPDSHKTELVRRKEEKLVLGEDNTRWKSTAKDHHDGRALRQNKDISYKVERNKYDTILGTKKTDEQIKNANNFEYYNPLKNKGYVANNTTQMPAGNQHFDIITGRKLPF